MTCTETDGLGTKDVDARRYWEPQNWKPQTERAHLLFEMGSERSPLVLIRTIRLQKPASAEADGALGELPPDLVSPIAAAKAEIAANKRDAAGQLGFVTPEDRGCWVVADTVRPGATLGA